MKKAILLLICFVALKASAQIVPVYETYTLKNGLKVYLLQYGKIPAINVKLVLNTGKVNEAPGQQNYSALVSDAILMGNSKYDAETQTNKAFALGTQLNSSATQDNTILQMNILSKDIDAGMDLMSAAVLSPTFPKEKMDLLVSQNIDFNSPTKMDIAQLANVFSDYTIYGLANPLGRYFYKAQLQKITPAVIKEYYDFNFTPKNANLIICGSFDVAAIKAIVEKYYGSWKSAMGNTNGVSLDQPVIKKREIAFINRNAATQCALQWTKIAPAVSEKDQLAFHIANSMFNEVLFKEIREKGGKTYGISSAYHAGKFSNLYSVTCSVRSSELFNTVELFDKVLADFNAKAVDAETFKETIYRQVVNIERMESPEEISGFYNPLIYNFEKRKNRVNELKALTLDDVQKAIKKYYTPGIYKLVVAGDEKVVADQLAKLKDAKKLQATDIEKDN